MIIALTVKNEAAVIERCLRSAAQMFPHGVSIVDTGCTDDTIAIARATCESLGLPLAVTEAPWQGFGLGFTRALDFARESYPDALYALHLDADETLVVDPAERQTLSAGGYYVCRLLAGDWEVWTLRLFRLDHPWRYEGVRHATPVCYNRWLQPSRLRGVEVLNHRDGAAGNQSLEEQQARFRRDVVHFLEQLTTRPEDPRDPSPLVGNTRSWYYLAQSAKDAGMRELAMWAYRRRSALSYGFAEEQYLSLLQIARWTREPSDWVDAIFNREQRHEAYCEYAQQLLDEGNWQLASRVLLESPTERSDDRFLVRRTDYQWRVMALLLLCELAEARAEGDPDSPPLIELAELAEKWDHPELWAMFEKARDGR